MMWQISAAAVLALGWTPSVRQDPMRFPSCKEISVTLTPKAQAIEPGEKPRFSIALSNATDRAARLLDVRHGRRIDLQENYFELFVVQGGRVVETPVAISDPGPLSAADFFELRPGERVEIPRISYTRAVEGLGPGRYEAYVLFWRDPMDSTTRCRSTPASFTVQGR